MFDGNHLRLNILLVPRLSGLWNGDPLLPVIHDFPNPGDTTPAFADADLRFQVRVLNGFERFPINDPVDFSIGLPEADGAIPMRGRSFNPWLDQVPAVSSCRLIVPDWQNQ